MVLRVRQFVASEFELAVKLRQLRAREAMGAMTTKHHWLRLGVGEQ